jgi:hypothetical protein
MSLLVVAQLLAQVIEPFYIGLLTALNLDIRAQLIVTAVLFIFVLLVVAVLMLVIPKSFEKFMMKEK